MTTIAEKLLIKPNSTVWLSEPGRLPLLAPMPDGVREAVGLATAGTGVLFADDAAAVRGRLDEQRADLDKPAAFWIAYPDDSLDPEALRPIAADFGMRPGEQIAIGPRWSAVRLEQESTGGR